MKKVYYCCATWLAFYKLAAELLCLFHIQTENLNSRLWQNEVTFLLWWINGPFKVDQWDTGPSLWAIVDEEITSCSRTMDLRYSCKDEYSLLIQRKKKENHTRNNNGRDRKIIQVICVLRLCSLRAGYPSFFPCEKSEQPARRLTFMKTELWNNSPSTVLGSINESLWISSMELYCLFHRDDDLLPNASFFLMFTVKRWKKKKHIHT